MAWFYPTPPPPRCPSNRGKPISDSADQTYRLSLTDNGDGTDSIVVRDNTPATGAHRFIRLNVQAP